jgi:[acyl-carrier-protein] S-malonyltransferase
MRTAALFPGQGSVTAQTRETVVRLRPDLLELAAGELGDDLFERAETSTAYHQPAVYCASLAGWSRMDPQAVDVVAGHSLGELTALVAAGALDEEQGLRLVIMRGRLMEAAERDGGAAGGMLAMRTSRDVGAVLARGYGLSLASDNSPEQVVLSGDRYALETLADDAAATGRDSKLLPIAGAFHSPAMESAREEFAQALGATRFDRPRIPVVSSVSVAPMDEPRRRLAESLTTEVRWRETLISLRGRGVRSFVEVGPGRVLSDLIAGDGEDGEAAEWPAAA